MKKRDLVSSKNRGNPLRCGTGMYKRAIVLSVDPLVLVSECGDMRWSCFPREDLEVVGRAGMLTYFKCWLRRRNG